MVSCCSVLLTVLLCDGDILSNDQQLNNEWLSVLEKIIAHKALGMWNI